MTTRTGQILTAAAVLTALASPAMAHTGVHLFGESGFVAGFSHPLLGLDHLLAMLGVGIWAAQLGGRATWLVPAAFVSVMVAGAALALSGAALPMVEFGIGGSVLAIGGLIALGARLPLVVAMGVVGLFALFHGHAHGTELPGFAHPAAYGAGFVLATALLHAAGFGIALLLRAQATRLPLRLGGLVMAAVGGYLLAA
ncbi:MAG TPA: HupE/UreJ family protein [Alphaproteobacteria bacterium]|nr:HupE/UreJ family protein [Alphaproteobacteria bacterium]